MCKVDISFQFFRDTLMLRKLFPGERLDNCAVVCCDCVKVIRKLFQEIEDYISNGLSCLALDLSQQSQARFAFCKRDNRMTMTFSDNRIHFPITQALASIHDSRSFVNTYPVFNPSTPVIAPIALPALFPWSGSSTGIVDDNGDLLPHVYP